MIQTYHVHKIYPGGNAALSDVTVQVERGEFVFLTGPSGAGKSTLLKLLFGQERPSHGEILVDGINVSKIALRRIPMLRRRIGMIFQHFNLVRRSKVITNVLAGRLGYTNPALSLFNHFSRADVELALQNLERVGIGEQAYKRADELSGGQQQRVGIARALMQNPELMLVDEPVSALDPATSHSIMRYLEELNKNDGVTIVCSLHFLSLARVPPMTSKKRTSYHMKQYPIRNPRILLL